MEAIGLLLVWPDLCSQQAVLPVQRNYWSLIGSDNGSMLVRSLSALCTGMIEWMRHGHFTSSLGGRSTYFRKLLDQSLTQASGLHHGYLRREFTASAKNNCLKNAIKRIWSSIRWRILLMHAGFLGESLAFEDAACSSDNKLESLSTKVQWLEFLPTSADASLQRNGTSSIRGFNATLSSPRFP